LISVNHPLGKSFVLFHQSASAPKPEPYKAPQSEASTTTFLSDRSSDRSTEARPEINPELRAEVNPAVNSEINPELRPEVNLIPPSSALDEPSVHAATNHAATNTIANTKLAIDGLTHHAVIVPETATNKRLAAFWAAAFLVSVPVFIQAPLVRVYPTVSLLLSALWFLASLPMLRQSHLKLWGDLSVGFAWTWLAGSLYWGWFRWEPLIHLPIEAIGLPVVMICLNRPKLNHFLKIGSYFYLGSLFGTVVTDGYFYWVDLIPYWRTLMQVPPSDIAIVLQSALHQLQNPIAIAKASLLLAFLLLVGLLPLRSSQAHWWAFSGAVLSTILVDALFALAAAVS
jgi:Protein of unknown function (DUF3120)